jgi:probable F420-dependent oxidoreductase
MIGVGLGRVGAWGHLDSFAVADVRAYARRVEELGYGTLWVPETVGREPFTLLGMLAGETSRLVLGTSIVGIWGHDAQTTRMASLTLSEATDGRFVLGLGVSHPHLAEKLRGHRFDRPLTHMREFLAAYRAAIIRASALDGVAEPPVLVAALRQRMTELAATDADGAFPYLVTPDHVAGMREILDAAGADPRRVLAVTLPVVLGSGAAAAASARAYLNPYLRTPTYQSAWTLQGFDATDWEAPGSDRLLDAMVAVGEAARVRARIDELLAAGADHVAIIPLGPDGTTEHLPVLEALAG